MSRRITENPFYLLELRPDCRPVDVETQGQKLLSMLEIGLKSAATYPTPLGKQPRDAESVRQSMAELRDPEKRLVHELWARLDPKAPAIDDRPASSSTVLSAWPEALRIFGWRP